MGDKRDCFSGRWCKVRNNTQSRLHRSRQPALEYSRWVRLWGGKTERHSALGAKDSVGDAQGSLEGVVLGIFDGDADGDLFGAEVVGGKLGGSGARDS